MTWNVVYHTPAVEAFILDLPEGLLARYLHLTDMMQEFGGHLGMPHTRALGEGLFELRVKSKEGIARVFYGTHIGQRIVILHGFVKKTEKTPPRELKIARAFLAEVKKS